MARQAAGGGRWVDVPPERLTGWLNRFADRHGTLETTLADDTVSVRAEDGSTAQIPVPFPPLKVSGGLLTSLAAHAAVDRTIGVLLVRLGGYAAGVFHGTELKVSKVDSRLVHGRSAAGGWSQHRFSRRRDGQARAALQAAAAVAARILLPYAADLDALVTGGDKSAVETVLEETQLAPLRPLVSARFLTVPDPKRAILDQTPEQFRALQILVKDITRD
jgi:hypothetical protein